MAYLPPAILARQRANALKGLTELCEVHRFTAVQNDLGEHVESWAPVGRNIPCRIVSTASVTGRERMRLEAIGQVTQWMIPLPAGTDVRNTDRIFVTSGGGVRDFEVSQVTGPHTDEVRRVAMVDEVN
jgi:head-tail adaptor